MNCSSVVIGDSLTGPTVELAIHDGTIRDLMFLGGEGAADKHSGAILVSGGAGDCKAHVTDCATGSVLRKMAGHTGTVIPYRVHR
jgi:hypothetical protein